jgi:transcriptional regulator PpsR
VQTFSAPRTSLGPLDAEQVARLISASADVALVVDRAGVVQDVSIAKGDLSLGADAAPWSGRPWRDTVAEDSRAKVDALLADALADRPTGWRQINYGVPDGADTPILYTALRLGTQDRVLAVGRDLRAVATMQQRLLAAQQTVERDYAKLRHTETRYRLLFKLSNEAVLFIDSASRRVVEANPAAQALLGEGGKGLVGRVFPHGLEVDDPDALETLLASVRAIGRADPITARLGPARREALVSAALFRFERNIQFMIRLSPQLDEADGTMVTRTRARLLDVIDSAPDGIVVTDLEGVILSANMAFLDFVQVATEAQVRGRPLGRFIGRPGVDMTPLISNLRDLEVVRQFTTAIHGDVAGSTMVEISAVAVPHADRPCLGFILRAVSERSDDAGGAITAATAPRSVEQLTELVGRVSLKDIIRETNDMIEKLCIQAALKLTNDNRASAAEMLGLSRQSLYVKLRRYGLGDLSSADAP